MEPVTPWLCVSPSRLLSAVPFRLPGPQGSRREHCIEGCEKDTKLLFSLKIFSTALVPQPHVLVLLR